MHQGEFIKKVLKDINITQEELADKIGISRGHLIKKLKEVELKEDKSGTIEKILNFIMLKESKLPPVTKREKIEYVLKENDINVDDIVFKDDDKIVSLQMKGNNETNDYKKPLPGYLQNIMNRKVLENAISMWDQDLTKVSLSELLSDNNTQEIPSALWLRSDFKGCTTIIKHRDEAMRGKFEEDGWIGVKYIPKEKVASGFIYVVITEHFHFERYVYYNRETRKFLLKPYSYEKAVDIELDWEEVLNIWLVKAHAPAQKVSLLS